MVSASIIRMVKTGTITAKNGQVFLTVTVSTEGTVLAFKENHSLSY